MAVSTMPVSLRDNKDAQSRWKHGCRQGRELVTEKEREKEGGNEGWSRSRQTKAE